MIEAIIALCDNETEWTDLKRLCLIGKSKDGSLGDKLFIKVAKLHSWKNERNEESIGFR